MLTLKEKKGTIVFLFVTEVILSKKKKSFDLISLISSNTTDLKLSQLFFKAFSIIFLPPLYPLTPVTWMRDWSLLNLLGEGIGGFWLLHNKFY